MICDERLQIPEAKLGSIKRATDDTQHERIRWNFISTVDLGALNFLLSIQADQALTNGIPGRGAGSFSTLRMFSGNCRFENCMDDLAIACAAAEHTTKGIHYISLGGGTVLLEKGRG
jgi:hypothetical protein